MTHETVVSTRMAGRVALVSGGAKGIGRAIALQLAAEGADVAIAVRSDRDAAETTAAQIRALGRRALVCLCDLTDAAAVTALVAEVESGLGPIALLVNNAGTNGAAPLLELTEQRWDAVVAGNLKSCFLLSVATARAMASRNLGAIVNIAGASAHRSYPGAGAYGPSKAAVVSLTVQMSLEWAALGIRVNGVSPGPIREAASGWQAREPALAEEVTRLPLRRAGEPSEVAKAVAYLGSDDASYVTGHMLIVDGGSVNTWYLAG
ncbi:SDR family NAD(P)-dependent oxidoreductase [Pseudomonas typographi]|uniref:SDR family oxidoreductase n=1 Tax=Pseudomonas typographi TaxID=2715964 RepID=A0ABR7YYU3_9PSED|nr:SDR family NAD(P)-dependent oxidoreductase [Pseudomonas typographi]MBD1554733.1 SDR family oxidoreductase [Pseudomonas typographi]MBD1589103.1 SDR family oxidoreductase [Pseudomonas typographi]MBD1598376.1 SDR family oxidoreductase [Pseudomonas typographi]